MEDPKVILIIDDEVDIVMMLKGLLKRKGYCVLTAHNGKEGLQKIAETNPHLIILDINMPEMDGASFYEHIYDRVKKQAKYPVMVLTARARLGELFAKLDVDAFMSKPFELDAFLHEVDIIMKRRYGILAEDAAGTSALPSQKKKLQNILVIEDDQDAFNRIVLAFANRGYVLSGSKTGVDGIEHAMTNPPDVILINLGLPDLAGDIVALKLKRMPKTMDIPVILYRPFDIQTEYSVEKEICKKAGIDRLIESDDPQVLLKEIERKWAEAQKA